MVTAIMVGVIWVIQLAHYPAFFFIDKLQYLNFQKFHMNRISIIVIPIMLLEIITGIIYLFYFYQLDDIYFLISFIFLIIIWISTAIFFTRIHQSLLNGFDRVEISKLVRYNWHRTILWTVRLILLSVTTLNHL